MVLTDNVEGVKNQLAIPKEMRSCHTSLIGDYYVEGHVPVEALRKLIEEQPQIDGIAMPGMPQGSPGMGGQKDETWVIYSISAAGIEEFITF